MYVSRSFRKKDGILYTCIASGVGYGKEGIGSLWDFFSFSFLFFHWDDTHVFLEKATVICFLPAGHVSSHDEESLLALIEGVLLGLGLKVFETGKDGFLFLVDGIESQRRF